MIPTFTSRVFYHLSYLFSKCISFDFLTLDDLVFLLLLQVAVQKSWVGLQLARLHWWEHIWKEILYLADVVHATCTWLLPSEHIYIYIYIYSKTSLTDHLHRSSTPLYWSLYFGPKRLPIQIFLLHELTTSLNGPPKVSPMVGRFREVLLCICIYIYIYIYEEFFSQIH